MAPAGVDKGSIPPCLQMGPHWGFRSRLLGCPFDRVFPVGCTAEPTRRSARPEACLWLLSNDVFGAVHIGVSDPVRCADKSPWIGQETPLDSSHIPPSFHEQHPSKPCPEGTFFHSPGFVRSTTLGTGQTDRISPEGAGLTGAGRRNRRRNSIGFAGSADRW
jgi:hypothetical protein